MKYTKLHQLAQAMPAEEQRATLAQLAADPRFAAVLKLILDQKEETADTACEIRFSNCHGALAHAAGGRHAMKQLENQIRAACDPPRNRAAKPPPEE